MNSLASFLTLILMLASLWALITHPGLAQNQEPEAGREG